jgi:cytochrome c-type biogenesis protein CcmH
MSEEDRNAMIETMVAGLDEKLRKDPQDLEGWFRLVRSYVVLGRASDARDAVRRATEALGKDSDAAKRLAAFSGTLGISTVD